MKNKKNNSQISSSEGLNLDPETKGILQTISDRLEKPEPEIIKEIVYSMDRLFKWNNSDENRRAKDDFAFSFNSMIQQLHILPQISENISLLSGRDTDIVIGNLEISLETNTVSIDLGLGLYDLEKIFVTMTEGSVQLFSNRHLSDKYATKEIEKIKEHARTVVKESVPYADVIIGIVSLNDGDKISGSTTKTAGLAAGRIINMKEVELTIRSHTIKYLPTFHKFNALLDEVVCCFRSYIDD